MPANIPPDVRIDSDSNEDNGEPPTVREAVTEVGTLLRYPTPVPAYRLHFPHRCRRRAGDEWDRPDGCAYKRRFERGDLCERDLSPDHEQSRYAYGED